MCWVQSHPQNSFGSGHLPHLRTSAALCPPGTQHLHDAGADSEAEAAGERVSTLFFASLSLKSCLWSTSGNGDTDPVILRAAERFE